MLSVKFPIVIFFTTSFVNSGEGFDFTAAAIASFTILFRSAGFASAEISFGRISNNNTGKPIPAALEKERGELVDAMADSQAHLHGKRFALYGDPDQLLGYAAFLLELGAEPSHVLSTNGGKEWAVKVQALFDSTSYGKGCKVYPKRDLWHLRSLLFTEPVDFMIGNTYGKYLERDTKTPLVRLVFPITDRHHYHRYATWGYNGSMRVLVMLLDEFFEALDASTMETGKTDYSYDIVR